MTRPGVTTRLGKHGHHIGSERNGPGRIGRQRCACEAEEDRDRHQ